MCTQNTTEYTTLKGFHYILHHSTTTRPRKIESGKCKCGVYARHPPQNHFFWTGVHPIYGENSDIGEIFSRTAHIAVKTATFSN